MPQLQSPHPVSLGKVSVDRTDGTSLSDTMSPCRVPPYTFRISVIVDAVYRLQVIVTHAAADIGGVGLDRGRDEWPDRGQTIPRLIRDVSV